MYIYIYSMFLHVCTYIYTVLSCMCVHVRIYSTFLHVCTYTYIYSMFLHVCTYIYTVLSCMCVHIYIQYVPACVYIYCIIDTICSCMCTRIKRVCPQSLSLRTTSMSISFLRSGSGKACGKSSLNFSSCWRVTRSGRREMS